VTTEGAEASHLERLRQAGELGCHEARKRRRGPHRQLPRRRLEALVRQQGASFAQEARRRGLTPAEAADRLGVNRRTLREWRGRSEGGGWPARLRGRPLCRAAPARRNEVITALAEVGSGASVAYLRQHFTDVARAELNDLRARYRRLYRGRQAQRVLHWQRPGSAWAIDYSAAPCLIEGCYQDLLAVRDLGSGYALWWQAVGEATAETTIAALVALFARWGRPLLLKADNGGHFRATAVAEMLEAEGVTALYSPSYTPRYNGAIEAGIGALKTRAHEEAARQGRAEAWTCADVEAAREEANLFSQPRGEDGPTPAESWQQRVAISAEERRKFSLAVQAELARREPGGYDARESEEQQHTDQAKRRREAISAALVAQGYLSYTRRRFPLPISRLKVT
jgi:DNA-binding transcriptional regulator YiaG